MSVWTIGAIEATALLALGLSATALLRRHSAALRHWILAVTILLAAAMPLLDLVAPAWSLPITGWRAVGAVTEAFVPGVEVAGPGPWLEQTDVRTARPLNAKSSPRPVFDATAVLVAGWLMGVAVAFGSLALALLRLGGIVRTARTVDGGSIRGLATGIALGYRLPSTPEIVLAPHPALVVTWGLRRPRVLLPASALQWTDERLRVVLGHEMAHVARADWTIQMAAAVARCLWWFNPLMWIACRRLRFESELASDDMVLASGIDRTDYATHLLDVAREATARTAGWIPAMPIAQISTLEGRIRAMLNVQLNRKPLTGPARFLAGALVVVSALVVAGGRVTDPSSVVAAAAQSAPGVVSGALYDQFGGLLPGVQIRLTHGATGGRYDTTTDPSGAFVFRDLPPGDYELTSQLPGFQTVISTLAVRASDRVRRNISLPLGTIEETITVAPDPPGVVEIARTKPVRVIPEPKVGGPCTGAIGGCIKLPRKRWHDNPRYPAHLAASGTSGVVNLTGRIGIDGYLADLRIREDPAVDGAFKAAALEAVQQWEFDPTLLNGAPVPTDIKVNVFFNAK